LAIIAIWILYVLASAGIACIWENWGYLHACYFTVINTTTVGFGDVVPSTRQVKILSGINAFIGLLLFGAFVASVTMALQPSSWGGSLGFTTSDDKLDQPQSELMSDENRIMNFIEGLDSLLKIPKASKTKEGHEGPFDQRADVEILIDRDRSPHYAYVRIQVHGHG
jgi:Ion channel